MLGPWHLFMSADAHLHIFARRRRKIDAKNVEAPARAVESPTKFVYDPLGNLSFLETFALGQAGIFKTNFTKTHTCDTYYIAINAAEVG